MRLLALLATLVFTHAAWAAGPVEVDRIVAVVNSDVVTRSDLRLKVEQISRQLTRQGTPLPAEDVLERQVLERLIMEKLQIQLANETSLRVDDLALDRALGRIADNNKLSMTEFRQALEKDGITWDRFREEIRTEMKFVLAETVDDVLKAALEAPKPHKPEPEPQEKKEKPAGKKPAVQTKTVKTRAKKNAKSSAGRR